VRDALDELASSGALEAVRGKWLGQGSTLLVAGAPGAGIDLLPAR
jgi:hypothetical protein